MNGLLGFWKTERDTEELAPTLKQHTCLDHGPDGFRPFRRDTLRSPAMSGRTNSENPADIAETEQAGQADLTERTGPDDEADLVDEAGADDDPDDEADSDADDDADALEEADPDEVRDARRARWIAAAAGALLTLAGLAAATLRATGSAPALVPAAYALGALVCALAALLGSRGRTRRALWLLVGGVAVMAFGDQFD
ncbi:hypothetical protein Stsp02_40000 [Streptomyces sp. NBRC 14336]|nr:hypothetical protein Stsp02_40000 [Streptomyces sp. NBRC 14336]